MKSLSSKRLVITALVVAAVYTVISNILPLFNGEDVAEYEPVEMFAGEDGQPDGQARARQAVNTASVFWVSTPQRNPFSNKIEAKMASGKQADSSRARPPALSGFVAGEQTRLAVINDRVVAPGDSIAGYRVTHIGAHGVQLVHARSRQPLSLSLRP